MKLFSTFFLTTTIFCFGLCAGAIISLFSASAEFYYINAAVAALSFSFGCAGLGLYPFITDPEGAADTFRYYWPFG